MHNSKNCCTFAPGKMFCFCHNGKKTPRNDLAVTAGCFFCCFFPFLWCKTDKKSKKCKKNKKNAKKFAYIKKKQYLCTEFKKKQPKK